MLLSLVLGLLLVVVYGGAKLNYYAVLGVDKKADQGEIKAAYRRLAMKTHPDKGGDAEQFKRVNEAYQVLSDSKKRETYDLYGEAEPGGTGGGNPFQQYHQQQQGKFPFGSVPTGDPMSDMLNELLGGLFGQGGGNARQQARPSRPVSQTIHCSLEELLRGCSKKYRVRGGAGLPEKTFQVTIKRDFKVGTKITYPPTRSFPLGVVFLLGIPKPHPLFTLRDDDLILKRPVKISREDKLNGAEKHIPTLLEGTKVTLKVDDTLRSGVRRFDGLGMHKSKTRGGGRGCLVVKVEVAG